MIDSLNLREGVDTKSEDRGRVAVVFAEKDGMLVSIAAVWARSTNLAPREMIKDCFGVYLVSQLNALDFWQDSIQFHDDRASEKRIIEFSTFAGLLPRDGKETSRKRLVKFG
jgi:hypothetical protein